VGELTQVTLSLVAGPDGLAAPAKIAVSPVSRGSVPWPNVQCYLPEEANFVSLRNPETVNAACVCNGNCVTVALTDGSLAPGELIELVYGDRRLGSPGIRMTLAAREVRFLIHVQPGDQEAVEAICSPALFDLAPAAPARLQL